MWLQIPWKEKLGVGKPVRNPVRNLDEKRTIIYDIDCIVIQSSDQFIDLNDRFLHEN
jgi:hypothetical protein